MYLILLLSLSFTGCDLIDLLAEPEVVDMGEPVFLRIPYLHADGGDCFWAAAAMVVCAYYNRDPEDEMIARQKAWWGQDTPGNLTNCLQILRDYWGMRVKFWRPSIERLYQETQQGRYSIAFIDGDGDYYHAVVIAGVSQYHVYTIDPFFGEKFYTHADWRHIANDSRGAVITILGEIL